MKGGIELLETEGGKNMIQVKKAANKDAEQVVGVMKNAELSGNMLYDPGERTITPASLEKFMEAMNSKSKSGFFVARDNDEIIGYMMVQNEKSNRVSHRASIAVGVHSDSRGKGVGTALFEHVISWAKEVGLHRLELTVIATNERAVHLYKKMGFEIEGVKKDSLCVGSHYIDEYYMAYLF